MSLIYADTSALLRAYFVDEDDHEALRALLLDGDAPVVTSELARLELASALTAAERARRLETAVGLLARIDADCQASGPIALVRLRPEEILETAYELLRRYVLRTLDAIHLAVALDDVAPRTDGTLVFATRDNDQAAAASALGFEVV